MAMEDRNGCLHGDDDGKFVPKDKAYDSKDDFKELSGKLNKTGILKKKKSIRSLNKRIQKHRDKINNPEQFINDFNKKSKREIERITNFWEKEIRNYERQVSQINNEIGE